MLERKIDPRDLVRPPALYVDHVETRGIDLFAGVCDQDLEGVVAKRAARRD